jgi:uncharacterized membrane protein YtjA (UPF0391 family)
MFRLALYFLIAMVCAGYLGGSAIRAHAAPRVARHHRHVRVVRMTVQAP